ncbi:MAG: exodeoxyribonuclease V subunit gamma, partial [Clostridia bacterium]|nr:exodeoxyribonuclease V subunit gamma [Clostridia bacterium]
MVKLISAYTLSECLDAAYEQIAACEQLGQKNLVFCEDRLTLVAERALMRRIGGTILTEITTFSRFLKTDEKVLSREGSVMAVSEIMLEKQSKGELKCFTSASGSLAGAKCIYEQLAQFAASELSPKELKESVALLPEDSLKGKMTDLAILYEAYDEFLKENAYLDEGKYLTLLPDCIKNAAGMSETNVFFLCYSSFTKQAKRTLAAAIESARNVVGVFLADDEELYTNQAYGAFYELAKDYDAKKRLPLKVQNMGKPLEGEAELFRKRLFATEALSDGAKSERLETDSVHIFSAPDRVGEAEAVAVAVRKHMMSNPDLHYRDFAVLVPSVEEYSLSIRKAFSEYSIPYSLDERISLKQHPLAKFILAVMEAVNERFAPACVDAIAKNVFFGDGDLYRNYLLKFGNYRGGVFKEIKAAFAEEYGGESYLNECKNKMEAALGFFKNKRFGREYCRAIELLLEEFSAGQVLNELILEAEDEGLRSYLSQIEKKLAGVLAEAELLAGGKEIALEDFASLLSDGLEATEIAPNPLRLDAVFVGDLTDSRIERVRILFALGMTDSVPRASDDANLITDQDKIKLQAIQAYLEPMVEEVNLRNRESLALNLCAFTDELYLSYPLGSNGEAPALSDVFRYVHASFVDGNGLEISETKGISEADFAYRCSALAPAARQLLVQKNRFEERKTDSRKLFSSLYEVLQGKDALPAGLEAEIDPYKYIKDGETLFLSKGALSPSLLESYFE